MNVVFAQNMNKTRQKTKLWFRVKPISQMKNVACVPDFKKNFPVFENVNKL